jgi:hypothetical protein
MNDRVRAVRPDESLYAHVPFCRKVLLHSLHFLFTCLRESHKATYEWLDLLETRDVQTVTETRRDPDGRKRTWTVRFATGVPLSGEDGARLGSRSDFFLHLHVLTVYHLFRSWEEIEDFIMRTLEIGPHAPVAPPKLTSKGLIRRYSGHKR